MVLAAVVFLVAEEILIWMISEMMTILGKNISKKPTPNRFLSGFGGFGGAGGFSFGGHPGMGGGRRCGGQRRQERV